TPAIRRELRLLSARRPALDRPTPALTPRSPLPRDELEQVGAGDDRHRPFRARGDERGGAAGEGIVQLLDVRAGLNDGKRRVHHRAHLLLHERRIAEDLVQGAALLHRADDVADTLELRITDDRELGDAVALHELDRRANGLALRDGD